MMSLRTQYEFLFIGRDEGSFVENYAYDLGEGGDNSGKIFINLEIQNNPVDAEAIGETIFDTVRKAFFADLEQDPYVRFEDAIRKVNKALIQMKEEKVSKFIGNLHVLITAVVNNTLYLAQTGEAESYLIRRRLSSTISEGLNDEGSDDTFSNIASGTLEPGDFVLFSSTRLLRYISKNDLARAVSNHNLIASLAELKDYLSTEVLGKIGIIGITVHESAPDLTSVEKGQIVEHLEKQEMYDSDEVTKKSGSSALQDTVSRLTGAVNDLRKRVSNMNKGGSGDRISRAGRGGEERWSWNFTKWSKDRLLIGVIAVIVVLTVGIMWMKARADEEQRIKQYENIINDVQEEISSAETTGQFNKEQAGEMLNDAESKALEVLNSGYYRPKANELLQLIQDGRDTLDGVIRPETRIIADLSEKRSNVSALGLLNMDNTLYAFEYNALYPVLLNEVQDPLTIDENETVMAATEYEDGNSLLFYTNSGKVIEYKDNRMTFVDTTDGIFKKGVAVQGYSNKFYVLDPDSNQIWRYTRRREKFDPAEAWNVNAELTNGVAMAIDGNVYVLNNDGYVVKMYSGNKEDFPIKKEPINPMTAPTQIFTELDMNQIYILEPSERRVLVFSKDSRTGGANYERQLVFDDLMELRDIYVDKDTNRLYLLDQTTIYEVAL